MPNTTEKRCCGFCNHIEVGKSLSCKNPACQCHTTEKGWGERFDERYSNFDLSATATYKGKTYSAREILKDFIAEVEREAYEKGRREAELVISREFTKWKQEPGECNFDDVAVLIQRIVASLSSNKDSKKHLREEAHHHGEVCSDCVDEEQKKGAIRCVWITKKATDPSNNKDQT